MNRRQRRISAVIVLALATGALLMQGLMAIGATSVASTTGNEYPSRYTLITGQSRG